MKRVILFAVKMQTLCAFTVLAANVPCDNDGYSHLLPLNREVPTDKSYRELVESRLSVTPFDYGRAISQPDLGPEWCVVVYSQSTGKHLSYWVTFTRPKSSLWQLTAGANEIHPERAANIKILRLDAKIPGEQAKLVKQAWSKMIKQAYDETKAAPSENMFVTAGATLLFAVQETGGGQAYAKLSGTPKCGTKAHALAALSETLIDYCRAKPAERRERVAEIEREAKRLLEK